MIQIPRSLARKLVAVLRKSVWAASRRKNMPPVLFQVGPAGLSVSTQYEDLAVRTTQRGRQRSESLVVPGQALQTFAAKGNGPVSLERLREDRGIARWEEGRRLHEQEFSSIDPAMLPPFPELPETFQSLGANFLGALDDATGCVALEPGRPSLTFLQLRGTGIIVSTDGKQLLWQTGYSFPWEDDLLVPSTRVFGCKVLQGKPASLGRTATHVVVRAGDWTIALAINPGAKFPDVEVILKNLSTDGTGWVVPRDEVAFLLSELPRMPLETDSPALTLDLGSEVRLRSRDVDRKQGRELVLLRSKVTGPALQVNSNPRFLLRVLKLGFHTFDFAPGKPAHSQEEGRHYVWMPLDSPPLPPNDEDERIYSKRPRGSVSRRGNSSR